MDNDDVLKLKLDLKVILLPPKNYDIALFSL